MKSSNKTNFILSPQATVCSLRNKIRYPSNDEQLQGTSGNDQQSSTRNLQPFVHSEVEGYNLQLSTRKPFLTSNFQLFPFLSGLRSSVFGQKIKNLLFTFIFFLFTFNLAAQEQRFPKPEFESGYEQPSPETQELCRWNISMFWFYYLYFLWLLILP